MNSCEDPKGSFVVPEDLVRFSMPPPPEAELTLGDHVVLGMPKMINWWWRLWQWASFGFKWRKL